MNGVLVTNFEHEANGARAEIPILFKERKIKDIIPFPGQNVQAINLKFKNNSIFRKYHVSSLSTLVQSRTRNFLFVKQK